MSSLFFLEWLTNLESGVQNKFNFGIGLLVSQSWFVVTLPHGSTELDKLSPLNPNGFCHFLVQLTIEDRVEEAVDRDHHKCKNFKYRTAKMNGIQHVSCDPIMRATLRVNLAVVDLCALTPWSAAFGATTSFDRLCFKIILM